MWALLGDIYFELLFTPEAADLKTLHNYAEHSVIEGKPKLQWTGDGLQERNWMIRLHSTFCDPDTVMSFLHSVAAEHKALPLSLGTGQYLGRYVIAEIYEQTLVTDQYGGTIAQTAGLKLKEWIGTGADVAGEAVYAASDAVPGAVWWDDTADIAQALEATGSVSASTLILARVAELGQLGLDVLSDVLATASGVAGGDRAGRGRRGRPGPGGGRRVDRCRGHRRDGL